MWVGEVGGWDGVGEVCGRAEEDWDTVVYLEGEVGDITGLERSRMYEVDDSCSGSRRDC